MMRILENPGKLTLTLTMLRYIEYAEYFPHVAPRRFNLLYLLLFLRQCSPRYY